MSESALTRSALEVIGEFLTAAGDASSRPHVVHALVCTFGSRTEPVHPVRAWEFEPLAEFFASFGHPITGEEFDRAVEFAFGGGRPYEWPLS